MTLCQETCPLDTANIVETARTVQKAGLGDKVEFLSISVDPARDTPAQLAAYRRLFTPPPANWNALTGTQADLDKLWKYLGVYHKKVPSEKPLPANWRTGQPLTYDIEHSDLVYFIDSSSRERFLLDSPGHVPTDVHLPPTMNSFLDADGHHRLAHPDASYWTVPQALQTLSWLTGHQIPCRPIAAPAAPARPPDRPVRNQFVGAAKHSTALIRSSKSPHE
jgi:protein SCO1/2